MKRETGEAYESDDAAIEREARDAFDASVDNLDVGTRSRLNRSRQRALAAMTGHRRARQRRLTWASGGAVAATAIVAVLLLRGPADNPTTLPVASNVSTESQPDPLDVLAAGDDLDLAAEAELDFYAWVELETGDDGVT